MILSSIGGSQCAKNVTKFRRLKPPIKSPVGGVAALPVNVVTSTVMDGPYRYLIKAADNPPQMKIAMPGQHRRDFAFAQRRIPLKPRGCSVPQNAPAVLFD